ncbi:MAG: methionyl-tRNA formyltransferase [Acidobacteria bacterium]|nr:methionyl-tRNA formyltransferase [Acidobacteriota bacterium]
MRIVFCGTPEFAVPSLKRLASETDFTVDAVVTQPDRPSGRDGTVHTPPMKEAAIAAGLHVFQPEKIKSDSAFNFFHKIQPDVVVIIAYGQIIPARLIAIPRFGWINVHASLLPKYRGAAPINWAIANGESRTGLTTMQIDAGLDTGPTLLCWETAIGPDETAPELTVRMAEAAAPLLVETLQKLSTGEISGQPQDHSLATLAPLLKKEAGRVDWSQSATAIYNRMRAFAPWPGTYAVFRGHTCHLWGKPLQSIRPGATPGSVQFDKGELSAACGDATWLAVSEVQMEGRKRLPALDFANGARLGLGDSFQ